METGTDDEFSLQTKVISNFLTYYNIVLYIYMLLHSKTLFLAPPPNKKNIPVTSWVSAFFTQQYERSQWQEEAEEKELIQKKNDNLRY